MNGPNTEGRIYWAELNPAVGHEQAGQRPVVILSNDIFNDRSGIAIAIASQEPRAGSPLSLEITTAKLPKRSWARIGQIRTLSVDRLGKKLGRLAPEELDRIVEGLNEIIGG